MATLAFPCLFFLLTTLAFADTGLLGINYGRVANNLPPPDKVVQLLKSTGINRVKIYDTDSTVLTALANSNISVMVCLPNEVLSNAASDQSFTDNWVKTNISKYYPNTKIESIAVGNEVFADPSNRTEFLVPAMKNVYNSLVKYKLDSAIKVSTPVALGALQNSYPSSAGSFKTELIEPVMKPMLDFLRRTQSYFMANVYPFFAYAANSDTISLDYALFKDNPGSPDSGNGLKYTNLFDAQLDAVYAAIKAIGYNDVKIVVTETGWPSAGDQNEIGPSPENAAAYNGNLMRRVLAGTGTPARPKEPLNVYLFALFNENQKTGPTSEKNYGLFYPNEQKVYDMPFTQTQSTGGNSTSPADRSNDRAPETTVSHSGGGDVTTTSLGQTWCVANGRATEKKLQAALDFACGEGGADCRPIQQGATCYDPNTLEAHASYAFNSYYQKQSRRPGTCDFGGVAFLVTQPPKYGKCEFPTGY
ncbi:putative Glucan endo-1,3-beta-glucosidase [Melia azedarach]|uniref:Glucan endo-1,3-beta-glucosidase n=1 Tax=Melia azedarach TaxID=155640 RepID=A0ACC1YQ60_MELAZ|nr:putative Glucan endo-1,3-beta-glucosidase [Melia azedarach]